MLCMSSVCGIFCRFCVVYTVFPSVSPVFTAWHAHCFVRTRQRLRPPRKSQRHVMRGLMMSLSNLKHRIQMLRKQVKNNTEWEAAYARALSPEGEKEADKGQWIRFFRKLGLTVLGFIGLLVISLGICAILFQMGLHGALMKGLMMGAISGSFWGTVEIWKSAAR
jgi:hypothetical protein